MKRVIVIMVHLLLASVVVTGILGLNSSVSADVSKVVILGCAIEPGPQDKFIVYASSSSTGAPTVAPMTSCAQALADVLAAGFKIVGVQSNEYADRILYNLKSGD